MVLILVIERAPFYWNPIVSNIVLQLLILRPTLGYLRRDYVICLVHTPAARSNI